MSEAAPLKSRHLSYAMVLSLATHGLVFLALSWELSRSECVEMATNVVYDFEIQEPIKPQTRARQIEPKRSTVEKNLENLSPSTSAENEKMDAEVTELDSQAGSLSNPETPVQNYLRVLRRKIELQRSYPVASLKLKEEGLVKIVISLSQKGDLIDAQLVQAAPYSRLNEAALQAIRKAGPFGEFPKEINKQKWNISVPIRFSVQ